MAWARDPSAPQFPNTPLEALEPQPHDYVSLLSEYGFQSLGLMIGVAFPCCRNIAKALPLYTGIWKHILLGTAGVLAGQKIKDLRLERATELDEVYRHYIQLHPEDFPPYERKLLKDVVRPWYPIR